MIDLLIEPDCIYTSDISNNKSKILLLRLQFQRDLPKALSTWLNSDVIDSKRKTIWDNIWVS